MAQPLQYTPRPTRTESTAREELTELLETCHRHGVLRLANDLIASNAEIARIAVDGLKSPGVLNALQNLSVLFMALSRMRPEQFYRIVFAAKSALDSLLSQVETESTGPQTGSRQAPGVTGAYRLLHDEQSWQKLRILSHAFDAFVSALAHKIENPISDFSGKAGRPS